MEDLIKRSDAIKAVINKPAWHGSDGSYYHGDDIRDALKDVPSADRPQGKWIWHEDEDICNCSECEFEIDATGCIEPVEYVGIFHFCPNCGSPMFKTNKNPLAGIEPKSIPTKKHTFVYRKGTDDD